MEGSSFFKILRKHKFGIFLIPIVVMVLVFFLVRKTPDVYFSKSRLSAGITNEATNESQQMTLNQPSMQDAAINEAFTNLLQTMQLKIVYDQVSYQLMLHDLTADKPFRPPSKLLREIEINNDARKHAIDVYTQMYKDRKSLNLNDPDQKGLFELIKSMGYDEISLKDKLKIYRVENSDFIDVYFESDDEMLTSFVVNKFCAEFINYYSSMLNLNESNAINFISELMRQKKDSLDARTEKLKNYKIKNRVLNLNEQAKSLYGSIADFESRLAIAEKEIEANTGALTGIDAKLNPSEKAMAESRVLQINKDIVDIKERLGTLNDEYVNKNFDSTIKYQIDSISNVLNDRIVQYTDRNVVNPLTTKQNLVNEKMRLEIELELAKYSTSTFKMVIANLQRRLGILVPSEAVIQSYESEVSLASEEYTELLKKYNQATVEFNSSVRVKQIEPAAPGTKMPAKKIILVIMSGVICAVLYLLVLFILFYFDDTIKVPDDLFLKTNIRVLGFLPVVKSSFLDIQKLWSLDDSGGGEIKKMVNAARTDIQRLKGGSLPLSSSNSEFKRLIRATRFEVNMALMGGRNLVITSLSGEEGKTLVALSLVSAFQMTNKKILLIDGNFLHPSITAISHPIFYVEDYLRGDITLSQLVEDGNITVLGNYGRDISLFEINNEFQLGQKMLELKDAFDIVIIEAPALDTMNQPREWIVVADRVLCVYEANTSIKIQKKEQINYLASLQGKFIGWVLNKVSGEFIIKDPRNEEKSRSRFSFRKKNKKEQF